MKKEYANAVRKSFNLRLQDTFPQFLLRKGEENVASGDRLYRHKVSDDLFLYIYLILNDNNDEFNIDIGHSMNDVFPIESFFVKTAETMVAPEICFRLTEFWDEKDPWWIVEDVISLKAEIERKNRTGFSTLLPEEYMPKIDALINESLEKLLRYAVPYFEDLIMMRGINGTILVG